MRKRIFRFLAVLIALAAAGLALIGDWQPPPDEIAVRTALYRHLMAQERPVFASANRVHYLAVVENWGVKSGSSRGLFLEKAHEIRQWIRSRFMNVEDPPDEVLRRLRRTGLRVVSVSRVPTSTAWGPKTWRPNPGDVVWVTGRIKWVSRTEAEVEGGWYEDVLCAQGTTYRLVKRKGRWAVVGVSGTTWES